MKKQPVRIQNSKKSVKSVQFNDTVEISSGKEFGFWQYLQDALSMKLLAMREEPSQKEDYRSATESLRKMAMDSIETETIRNKARNSIRKSYTGDDIYYDEGITTDEADQLRHIYGENVLPNKLIPRWYLFVIQLWHPMAIMIWVAAILEGAIGKFYDMAILLFIQLTNAIIHYNEVVKAEDVVSAMKNSLSRLVYAKRDGEWILIEGSQLVPADLIYIVVGSVVPADCRICEGQVDVDQAEQTGESLPVTKTKGDSCMMGSKVVRGETLAIVESTGSSTYVIQHKT